jgi:hypothetical protein
MLVRQVLLKRTNDLLRSYRLSVRRLDQLTSLADRFGSDKGTLFNGHGYTRVYSRLFQPLRGDSIVFLEVGLHRFEADKRRPGNVEGGVVSATATKAPSLAMWQAFFSKAKIFGFDIDDFSSVSMERCTILRGDMSSSSDLERLVQAIGGPIDVVIDDASHASHHQQIALGHIFPHVRSGGLYIIEDLCWQDEGFERAAVPKTRNLLRRLQVDGVFESPLVSEEQRKAIEENLREIRLFDSLSTDFRDPTDALAVLIKK